MKKSRKLSSILSLTIITIFICSCSIIENREKKSPDILILTKGEETTASINNEIGFKLLNSIEETQIKEEKRENVIVSPLSYNIAMAMLWNGAAEETREALKRGLGFDNLTDEDVNNYFKKILKVLPTTDPQTKISLANSIWHQNGYSLDDNYIDINNRYFNTEISPIDFSNNKSVEIINTWCSEKTNGMIDNIVDDLDGELIAMLINALYFKGEWSNQFEKSDTRIAPFYSPYSKVEVDMMYQSALFNSYSNDLFRSITLPYGNNAFSMTVILPEESSDITSVLDHINSSTDVWSDIVNRSTSATFDLYLPKFKFEYDINLRDFISQSGMEIIYTPSANFSNMMKQSTLCVSFVKQKAIIEVDEKGTEAAAVTSIGMVNTAYPSIPQFRVDRPFIFVISENSSSSILFIGKVEDPS